MGRYGRTTTMQRLLLLAGVVLFVSGVAITVGLPFPEWASDLPLPEDLPEWGDLPDREDLPDRDDLPGVEDVPLDRDDVPLIG